jgi:hypothetical protein
MRLPQQLPNYQRWSKIRPSPANAQNAPFAVISTRMNEKLPSKRPRPVEDGGSYVRYTSNDTQVSYEWSAAVVHSRIGDKVRFCLVSIPKDCPPGDNRGRVYKSTNLRTGEVWTMQDDPHMCGGA